MAQRIIQTALMAAFASAATLVPTITHAQTIMREDAVSEQRLIEALKPVDPGVRTRSIRVQPAAPAAAPPAPPSPTASILITFETNSARLTPAAMVGLDTVARALGSDQLARLSFVVEGHADPRGAADLNMTLSERRARAVRDYLVNTHGIASSRLRAVGRGENQPLNTANPAAPENRRVTFVTQVE